MTKEPLQQQLALLYQLQTRDQELLSIQEKLRTIPRQIEQLAAEVQRYEKDIETKSAELTETERVQRSKNAEIEMNSVQREKYRDEQRTVTSNEAYTALERQIEFLDEQDGAAEDVILTLMEESDRLKEELAELEIEINKEKEKTAAETEQLQQELHALEAGKDEKLKQRKAFLPKVDKGLRDEYHRWMKAQLAARSSAARTKAGFVALEENGTCGSCRIAIQPQTLKEAQKYEKQVYCSSCKRLLYIEPAESGAESS